MHPLEAFERAPTGCKFNSDALARCLPAGHVQLARLVFFEHAVGANGTAAQEGSNEFPLLTKYCGGIPPKLYKMYVVPPRDHHINPL